MSTGENPAPQQSAIQQQPEAVQKRKLSGRDWIFIGVVGLVTGIFSGAIIGYASGWTLWDVDEFGAYGAWASAFGATALAVASVWLAADANKNARKAEARAERDIEERRQGDIRDREYQATELVMKGISALVSEVYSYKEYADGQPTWNVRPMNEPAPEGPLARRRELRRSCNMSATEIRLALMQITHSALQNEARNVMSKVVAVVNILFTKEGNRIDINAAVEAVDAANEAGLSFQKAADTRFRNPGQFVGLEFPQMSINDNAEF